MKRADLLPMLAVQGQVNGRYPESDYAAEGKFDGWRAGFFKDMDGSMHLYGGRNGAEYTGQVPYLEEAVARVLPPFTFVDGELMSPKGHGAVQSSMTTIGAHRPSIGLPELYFVMFDLLWIGGQDIRDRIWAERRRLLEAIKIDDDMLLQRSLILPGDKALDIALDAGLEGIVLKRRQSRYVNARSSSWVKIKPQETLEARVVGFKPGEGSFAGMVGALEFEILETGVRSRCSGFDMKTRQQITDHKDEWLGKIIEVKHHGISKDGKPRHPQFLRLRPDRDEPEPPKPEPKPAPTPRERPEGGFSGRNYGAMGDTKLRKCIVELENRSGDAYDRCVAKRGDPAVDLDVARAALEARLLRDVREAK